MIATTPDQDTIASFNALKRTARNDDDVLNWFYNHPQVLPNFPEPFWPYMEMQKPSSLIRLSDDKTHFYLKYDLGYASKLPHSSNAALKSLVPIIRYQDGDQIRPEASAYMTLALDMREWSYVAATAAYKILYNKGLTANEDLPASLFTHFDNMFPDMPWERLKTFHAAGVLVENMADFVCWLCDFRQTPGEIASLDSSVHALPDDLAY